MTAPIANRALFYLIVILMVGVGVLNIAQYNSQEPEIIVINTSQSELSFWENVQKQNPTYRDAYLILAQIKSQEGDVLGAQTMIETAQEVDPFTKVIQKLPL